MKNTSKSTRASGANWGQMMKAK